MFRRRQILRRYGMPSYWMEYRTITLNDMRYVSILGFGAALGPVPDMRSAFGKIYLQMLHSSASFNMCILEGKHS